MKIEKIVVSGNIRTRESIILAEFARAENCRTPQETFDILGECTGKLRATGVFDSVETTLEFLENTDDLLKQRVIVNIALKEKGIPFLSVSGDIRTNHGIVGDVGGDIKAGLRNPLGYGEMISVLFGKGAIGGSQDWKLSFSAPMLQQLVLGSSPPSEKNSTSTLAGQLAEAEALFSELSVPRYSKPTPYQKLVNTYFLSPWTKFSNGFANGNFSMSIGARVENFASKNSLLNHVQGLSATWTSSDASRSVSLDVQKRDELPVTASSSILEALQASSSSAGEIDISRDLRALCRPSVKSAVKFHQTVIDTRDSKILPLNGRFCDVSIECALLPWTTTSPCDNRIQLGTKFIKSDMNYQWHKSWGGLNSEINATNAMRVESKGKNGFPGGVFGKLQQFFAGYQYPTFVPSVTLSTALSVGVILPLDPYRGLSSQRIHLSDRYSLGGPLSLRGFELNGAGHQASHPSNTTDVQLGNALGGSFRSSLLMAASVPFPISEFAQSCRAFVFVNAGSLGNLWCRNNNIVKSESAVESAKIITKEFLGAPRCSVGVGLAINFAEQARLEFTYSVPVIAASSDRTQNFQFGIGLTIM